MNSQTVDDVLTRGSREDKSLMLADLEMTFDEVGPDWPHLDAIVKLLIKHAVGEEDPKVRSELLSALSTAARCHDMERFDLDPIADGIDGFAGGIIEAIDVLAFSHKRKYIPVLRRLSAHPNKYVAAEAAAGLVEIEGRK